MNFHIIINLIRIVINIMNAYQILNELKFGYSTDPKPHITTFVLNNGICQFCQDPKGETHCFDLDDQMRFGFISCSKNDCINEAEKKIEEMYNKANWKTVEKIVSSNFKIKRTNGNFENDWKFMNRLADTEGCKVKVSKDNLIKYIPFGEIIEWNMT